MNHAAHLLRQWHRRSLAHAAALVRPPGVGPRRPALRLAMSRHEFADAIQPRRFELQYTRLLLSALAPWHARIWRELSPLIEEIARKDDDGVRLDAPPSVSNRIMILRHEAEIEPIAVVDRDAEGIARNLSAYNRSTIGRSLSIDPYQLPDLDGLIGGFRKANVDLINGLRREVLEQVAGTMDEMYGARVETIRDALQERFSVSDSRASLWARDQVLKLNADMTQERHQAVGIVEYEWTTTGDERVREGHRELDGKRFRYDGQDPIVDHETKRRARPGKDYQCRCTPAPVIP